MIRYKITLSDSVIKAFEKEAKRLKMGKADFFLKLLTFWLESYEDKPQNLTKLERS